jgi:LAO/AO transport system kinase
LKAGLFEIADVFCVNKSDLPGADLAAKDLGELVGLGPGRDAWRPAVVMTSTPAGTGVDDLWNAIDAHEKFLDRSGLRAASERQRLAQEIVGLVADRVGRELRSALDKEPELQALLDRVVRRSLDPHSAADRLYRDIRRGG